MAKIKRFFIRTGIILAGLIVLFLVCHTALNFLDSNIIALSKVRSWEGKSHLLDMALGAHLQARGGLLPIEEKDYDWFKEEFKKRII